VSEKDLVAHLRSKDPLFLSDKLAATQPVLERYAKWVQELGFLYLFHTIPPATLELLTCKEEFDIGMP